MRDLGARNSSTISGGLIDGRPWIVTREPAAVLRPAIVAALVGACAPVDGQQQPDIVGSWQWSRKKDGCIERYVFRQDGTLSIQRGGKLTQNTYRMSWAPEPGGRYRVNVTTVGDDGGRDCDGSAEDAAGRQTVVYVLFGQSRETMIQCASPDGADCTGLMQRTAR
jgi:hypothetical protein